MILWLRLVNGKKSKAHMDWISIKDRLPPLDVYVLLAIYDGREKVQSYSVHIARRCSKNQWVIAEEEKPFESKYAIETHWMLLPDDPKTAEKVY